MQFFTRRKGSRSQVGMTLLEMLAAISIMGISGAGIAGLLMLNGMTTNRLSNKVDSLNNARQVIERIGKDVRMARNIGDVFGNTIQTFDAFGNAIPITMGSNEFPSDENPKLYAVNGGWPWGFSENSPMTLSSNTLIVQVPVFDANGFPTGIAVGQGNPPTQSYQDNVDTYVYKISPDPDLEGTYKLEVAGFPGPGSNPAFGGMHIKSNPPLPILRGIVGPIDPATGIPGPFQYVDRIQPTAIPKTTGANNGEANANLTGVVIAFELKTSTANAMAPATVGIKTEVYMRNNALSTVNANH
jgi:prepilin-type N-terminal cleavage/methylation domain-containing protein